MDTDLATTTTYGTKGGVFRYYKVGGHPLEFVGCNTCGELRTAALRKRLINNRVMCMNCSTRRKKRKFCNICTSHAPHELHHIAGRTHELTVSICLNCHARISQAQQAHPALKHSLFWGRLFIIAAMFECAIFKIGDNTIKSQLDELQVHKR